MLITFNFYLIGEVERYDELLSYLLEHYKLEKVDRGSLIFSPGRITLTSTKLIVGSDTIDMRLLEFLKDELIVNALFEVLEASRPILEKVRQALLEDAWLNKIFRLGRFEKLYMDDYGRLIVDAQFTISNFKLFLEILEKMCEEARVLAIAESMKK